MTDHLHKNDKEVKILQFNQMKGIKSGLRQPNKKDEDFKLSNQKGIILPGNYLIAVVEGDKII